MISVPSNEVFEWKYYKSWKESIESIYSTLLTPAFIQKIKRNRKSIEYKKQFSVFCSLSGLSEEEILTTGRHHQFRKQFSFLRVYHSCRPVNPEAYYEKGLLINNPENIFSEFCEIFLRHDLPHLKKSQLKEIYDLEIANPKYSDIGKLYVGLDDRYLIDYCGHYLIYGSESLHAWALKLPGNCPDYYREILRSTGKPTMFCLNLPNTERYVPDFYMSGLLRYIFSSWMYNTAYNIIDNYKLSFTIKIRESLSPQIIVSHYFPERIPDNHYLRKIYDCNTGKYI